MVVLVDMVVLVNRLTSSFNQQFDRIYLRNHKADSADSTKQLVAYVNIKLV